MSKIGLKITTKKVAPKLVKRLSKTAKKVTKVNTLKITMLPDDSDSVPYIKSFNNINNENNLKVLWYKEDEDLSVYT